MTKYSVEDAITDLEVGLAYTLGAICNQLLDRGALNRELLLADLEHVQSELSHRNVGKFGLAVPATLAHAIQQNAPE